MKRFVLWRVIFGIAVAHMFLTVVSVFLLERYGFKAPDSLPAAVGIVAGMLFWTLSLPVTLCAIGGIALEPLPIFLAANSLLYGVLFGLPLLVARNRSIERRAKQAAERPLPGSFGPRRASHPQCRSCQDMR